MSDVFAQRFLLDLRRRLVDENRNFLILVTGQPGSGKSYACLSLADKVAIQPISMKDVFFDLKTFIMHLKNTPDHRGRCYIFEEMGISMGSRESMTKRNRALGKVLQVMRNLNFGICFNVPDLSFVDKQLLKLCHYHMEMHRVDRQRNMSYGKLHKLVTDQKTGKIFYMFPAYHIANEVYKIKLLGLPKPKPRITRPYELAKTKFNDDLYGLIIDELDQQDAEKPKRKTIDFDLYADKIRQVRDKCLNTQGTIDPYKLRNLFPEVSHRSARVLKARIDGELTPQEGGSK